MKTKMYSISMKAVFTIVAAFVFTAFVNGQFQTPDPDSPVIQAPSEEVRTGSTVTYDLDNGNHVAGEQYRWVVTGGTITTVNTGDAITGGGTIVEFATDAHTITVDWDQAPTAIASVAGTIQVQKLSADGCPSQLQTLNVDVWNLATASFADVTDDICSGASPNDATITVDLTGAPDGTVDGFSVSYAFTVPAGLDALDGASAPVATTGTLTTDGASVDITMPVTLINNTAGDLDFVVNITAMNDDFTGAGTFSGTYTLTVHPVPETGDIESTLSLTRRL